MKVILRNSFHAAIILGLYALALVFLSGCAGATPEARWAEKRQAMTSLNNTFSDAVERGQLSDRQTVQIGDVLKIGSDYLNQAKQELPEGGTKFDNLLRQTQRVLDLIEAQLLARKKDPSNESSTRPSADRWCPRTDRQLTSAVASRAAGWRDYARATRGDRTGC